MISLLGIAYLKDLTRKFIISSKRNQRGVIMRRFKFGEKVLRKSDMNIGIVEYVLEGIIDGFNGTRIINIVEVIFEKHTSQYSKIEDCREDELLKL